MLFGDLVDRVLDCRVHCLNALILELLLFLCLGRALEVRHISTLIVNNNLTSHVIEIGLAAAQKLARLGGKFLKEIFRVEPLRYTVRVVYDLGLDLVKDGLDVLCGVGNLLGAHNTFEYLFCVRLMLIVHNTRAVDEINTLRQRDVLPRLGLARDRCDPAACLLHERVDDGALADVGVPDETHADVLLVLVKDVELLEQLDQRAFAERVLYTCLECQRRRRLRQEFYPLLGD